MTAKLQAKVVTLEKEIERLKNDNKRLRTLKTINEGTIFHKFAWFTTDITLLFHFF